MTSGGLVLKNLMRRKARTALTVAGVAIGVGLIVALLSITEGVKSTANELIHVGRSDFGLFQEGASDLTRSVLPESLEAKVREDPGVADTAGIFLRVGEVEDQDEFLLFGFREGELAEKRNVVIEGRRARGMEAMLGDRAAKLLHLGPGDTLHIGNRAYPVAGVYHSGDRFVDLGATLPLRAVQALAQRPNEISTIGVTVKAGETPKAVAKRLERKFPGVVAVVEPGQAVRIDTSSRLLITAGWIFSLLALVIGGIGVTNTMAMSVFERIREIGIMRAVGWTSTRIAALIVSEALGICLIALGIGLFGGWAAAVLLTDNSSLSSLAHAEFTAGVFAWGLAFALGVGLIGALYPAWRAIKLTPIEALRRE
ncbi:MAG TPA: ABC transporter permease [Gaiellaceae bacterium]|nr:ABC transporter permease [Gaiellaceae bacterium]